MSWSCLYMKSGPDLQSGRVPAPSVGSLAVDGAALPESVVRVADLNISVQKFKSNLTV